MAVFNSYALLEAVSPEASEETIERKLLSSKIKSLNNQLASLIQKKIRIDLEIKRTKRKLTKIKNQSLTNVKMKVELEGFNYDSLSQEQLEFLQESIGQEDFKSLLDLDEQIILADRILKDYQDLPLYEDTDV